MTFFGDGPLLQPEQEGIHELPLSTGRYVGESAANTLAESPLFGRVPQNFENLRAREAQPADSTYIFDPTYAGGIPSPDYSPPGIAPPRPLPTVPMEEARKRVKEAGLEHQMPNMGDAPDIPEGALDVMMRHARERAHREAQLARGPSGFLPGVAATGAGFFAGALDPLNIAAFSVPVVGEARIAKLMAGAGDSIMARAAVRGGVGLTQGAVGTLPLIPLDAYAYSLDARDYGFADALKSIAMNAGLGGVLHAAGGGIADVYRGYAGKPLYPFAPGEPFERTPGTPPGTPPVPPPPGAAATPPVPPPPPPPITRGMFPGVDELIAHPEVAGRTAHPKAGFNVSDVLSTPRVAEAIETPNINREHDVPYGSLAADAGGVFIDRNVPAQAEIDGVKFSPALPLNVARQVEREALERLTARFHADKGREPTDRELEQMIRYTDNHYVTPAEKAWVTSRGIDWDQYQEAKREWRDKIDHENPAHPPEGAYTKPLPPRLRDRLRGGARPPEPPAAPQPAPAPQPSSRQIGTINFGGTVHPYFEADHPAEPYQPGKFVPPSAGRAAIFADGRWIVGRVHGAEMSGRGGSIFHGDDGKFYHARWDAVVELQPGQAPPTLPPSWGASRPPAHPAPAAEPPAAPAEPPVQEAPPAAAAEPPPAAAPSPEDTSADALAATFRDEVAKMRAEEAAPSPAETPKPQAEPAAPRYKSRTERIAEQIEKERAAGISPLDLTEMLKGSAGPITSRIPNKVMEFAPGDITIDAARFQFKSGGDAQGVTDRLRGVDQWDQNLAGMLLVWESADGKFYGADGHQRAALANRIAAEHPEQNPRLVARVLSEKDGITDRGARTIAALTNIAEGTGTAIDAAKILRDEPDLAGRLPPRSELVRQARGLANLEPEAFRMVIDEVAPANYAAIVGRLAPKDGDLQKALIGLIEKTDPANVVQAESIVRFGLARAAGDASRLPSGEEIGKSLFTERARILDLALKDLRRDKVVFTVLSRERERIEEAGNTLAADINEKRRAADEIAVQILQTLAARDGPVADALHAAAERLRADGRPDAAVREFVARLRGMAESGELARLADSGAERPLHAGAQDAERVADTAPEQPADVDVAKADKQVRRTIRKARETPPPAVEPAPSATEPAAAPSPEPSAPEPTTAEVAKAAGKAAVSALDEAATGLWELFGKGKRPFGGLPGFDEETYAAAKPHFVKAAYHFREFTGNVHELMRRLVRSLKEKYGFNLDAIEAMEPYAIRFVQDVHSGAIDLKRAVTEQERTAIASRLSGAIEKAGRPREEAEMMAAAIADRYVARAAALSEGPMHAFERANVEILPAGTLALDQEGRQYLQRALGPGWEVGADGTLARTHSNPPEDSGEFWTPNRVGRLREMRGEGKSFSEIGNEFGVSRDVIAGKWRRLQRPPPEPRGKVDVARLRELRAQGMNAQDIAKEFGVTRTGINWHLEQIGLLPTREEMNKISFADLKKLRDKGFSAEEISAQTGVALEAIQSKLNWLRALLRDLPTLASLPKLEFLKKPVEEFSAKELAEFERLFGYKEPGELLQRSANGEPQGRVTFTNNARIIELFKKANASTAPHEFGHVWLDELHEDAARPDAPDWLKQDLKTVRDWLGAKGDDPLTTEQHEQFARGFEQYLREGRAPSRRLAAVFAKFAEWMRAIYRKAQDLGVEINDDVRGVMDRMLATHEDIAEYANDRPPLEREPMEHPPAPGEEAGPTVNPATGTNEVLPPVQSQEVLKGAIGSLIEGRPVRAGEQIEGTKEPQPTGPDGTIKVDAEDLQSGDSWQGIGGKTIIVEKVEKVHGRVQATTNDGIKEFDSIMPLYVRRNAPTAPPQQPPATSGPRAKDPADRSLFEHLAANGGIKPDADLQHVLGRTGPFVPGWGPLLRPNGKPIDLVVRDGDVEAYLGKGATVRDLMAAINDESRGRKRYQMGNEPVQTADTEASRAAHEREVIGMLEDAGIARDELGSDRIARVIEIMQREHVDNPEVAFEQAVMEEARRHEDAGNAPAVPPELHVPGWDDDGTAAPPESGVLQPFESAQGGGTGTPAPSGGQGPRAPPPEPVIPRASLADHFRDYFLGLPEFTDKHSAHLEEGNRFATIVQARRFAKEMGFGDDAKAIDEAIEQGAVAAARAIALGDGAPADKFAELVKLYDRQPRLSVRTSTSMRDQAYSTPVPLAYLASRLARVEPSRRVYEPSAGSGALLMEVEPPEYAVANEINPARANALRDQGFKVTERDASDPAQGKEIRKAGGVDAVIANPPFGAVKEGTSSKVFDLSDIQRGYKTHEIDHAIVLRSLEAMKDDGRAVLLIGGVNKLARTTEARSEAYNGKAKREFFKVLQDRYNVTDMFTVAGELYERQGAGWPIDVIVIEGRGKSAKPLPAVEPPRVYKTWDELAEVLNAQPGRDERVPGGEPGATPVELPPAGEGAGDAGGGEVVAGSPAGAEPAPVERPEGIQPGTVPQRPGGDVSAGGERPAPAEEVEPAGGRRGTGGLPDEASAGGRAPGVEGAGEASKEAAEATKEALEQAAEPVPETTKVRPRIIKTATETGAQVAYTPQSSHSNLGTLVPVNMKKSVSDALAAVAERHSGDIDKFVADELGYDPEEIGKYLAAEQIDAVALALDNIKRGKGAIVGDQTGIGKGRVNASIIRWARRNGLIPIFVTEKPNLYGDMYRDLRNIRFAGMLGREPRFLITNADADVPLSEDGTVQISTPSAREHNAMLAALPRDAKAFLKKYDVVFTTYNQMQPMAGEDTARREFLRSLAPNSVLIFDESHNAGGQGAARKISVGGQTEDRAMFARSLVGKARGVFYSSATFAKRPDVMDLYSKTDMVLAVDQPVQLGAAIAKGGVPMQQVVSAMLARAGQYIRRERSFAGVEYNTPTVDVNRKTYDGFSRSLAAINQFSKLVKKAAQEIDQSIKAEAEAVGGDQATGDAGARSTNFTSIMHNVINQMLLATKAKPAARMALEALERGEKPVLTVSGTMESFINGYVADLGIKPGEPMPADFGDVLKKYLDRTRTLIIKKPFMKKGEKGERKYLSDAELGPAGVAAYKEAKRLIESLDLKDLPVSPIDAIKDELRAAGYSVGEITGRGTIIDYSGKRPILRARPGSETSIKGRRETISRFNGGENDKPLPKDKAYDAMVLNQAGSTGLSIHAGEDFADQRPRHMFIVQPEANIDTHMQLLGRIHRTGQVVLPRYSQLIADIPAEKRPAAVLAKKMASLNANTTAARGGAMTAKDVPDFLNVYGDMVAAAWASENPELNWRLGEPIKIKENGSVELEGAMKDLTGRIPLFSYDEQVRLYDYLETEYNSLLEQMKAAGENALEAQTLDLRAQTVERREVVARREASDSPFAAPVSLEKAMVRRLGKPFRSDEVVSKILDNIGHTPPEGVTADNAARLLDDLSSKRTPLGQRAAQVHERQAKDALGRFDDYKRGILDDIDNPDKAEAEREKQDATRDRWTNLHNQLAPGERVNLRTANGNLAGIVLKIEQKGKPKNPLALSTWKVEVAIADATRRIELPFSRLYEEGRAPQDDQLAIEVGHITDWAETKQKTLDRFDSLQSDSLEPRYIATGNLLAAYDWLKRKGRIVNYTDAEGHTRQGILTPKDFDLAKHAEGNATAIGDEKAVMRWLRDNRGARLSTNDRNVEVALHLDSNSPALIDVVGSRRLGGMYYLDKELTGMLMRSASGREQGFIKRGGKMAGLISEANLEGAIRRIQELGGKFVTVKELPPAEQVSAPAPPEARPANPREAWDRLAKEPLPHEEREAVEFSRAAEKMKEPESVATDPAVRVKAAEKLGTETAEQFENAKGYMSDEDRAAFEAAQQEYDREQARKAEAIRQGIACLSAGGFGKGTGKP